MSFTIPKQFNDKQIEKLESIFLSIELMRQDVKENGDDCDLSDTRMGVISELEELYLMFSRERKTYL